MPERTHPTRELRNLVLKGWEKCEPWQRESSLEELESFLGAQPAELERVRFSDVYKRMRRRGGLPVLIDQMLASEILQGECTADLRMAAVRETVRMNMRDNPRELLLAAWLAGLVEERPAADGQLALLFGGNVLSGEPWERLKRLVLALCSVCRELNGAQS